MPPIAYNTKKTSKNYKYVYVAVAAIVIILLLLLYRKTMKEDWIGTPNTQQSQKEPTKEDVMKSISAPPDANPQPVSEDVLNSVAAPQKKKTAGNMKNGLNETQADPNVLKSLTAPNK
jgi:hypothetical protein